MGLSIGGQDVVLVRQDKLSNMEPSQLKNHLDELGDQLFTGICNYCPQQFKSREQKHKVFFLYFFFYNLTLDFRYVYCESMTILDSRPLKRETYSIRIFPIDWPIQSSERENHFKIFEHIRGFNVINVTQSGLKPEIL